MASIRDTLTKLLASDKPEPGTPLANYVGQYPFQQGEAPLEAPMFSPDDLIGTGIGKAALAGGAKLAPLLLGHTAFHGSPHVFDKFMLEKLGTGEGAQAYGHGMYFAEHPKTAEDYAKKLGIEKTSMSQLASDYFKKDVPPSAIRMLHDVATSATPIEEAARKVQGGSIALRNESPDVLKNIVSDFRNQSQGNIYKVDIPDEYIPKMLDWDKPINEQSIDVRKSLAPYIEQYGLPMNEPGRSAHSMMLDIIGKREGLGSGSSPKAFKALAPKAAEELNKAGIKGIKYLDQGSRDIGQGTNNFVVFDPSNVKILERNNKIADILKQQ